MPRTGKPEHERVLNYFETAHPAEAKIVLAMAKNTVTRRETEQALVVSATQAQPAAPAKRRGPKPGSKRKASSVIAMPTPSAPPAKAKGKPGPKPGSKRKARTAPTEDIVDGSDPASAEDFNPGISDEELEAELASV